MVTLGNEEKEVIEVFLRCTLPEIKQEEETPAFNIVFQEKAIALFNQVKQNPYHHKGYREIGLCEKDIEHASIKENQDSNLSTLFVKDEEVFFHLLAEICRKQERLYNCYGEQKDHRTLLTQILRRIWLRMGICDLNQVETFLMKQLSFLEHELLDNYRFPSFFTNFDAYDVTVQSFANRTWDESSRSLQFIMTDKQGKRHTLPQIYCDFDKENTCYLSAIQKPRFKEEIKGINRKLRQFNHLVANPNVPPSFVYTMLLFVDFLEQNHVTKIKVPTLQVFSYRYHELLSEQEKERFSKQFSSEFFERLSHLPSKSSRRESLLNTYQRNLTWYQHIVDQQDAISKRKTENLLHLMYRIEENHLENFEIINDIDNQSGYLEIELKNKTKTYKKM